MLVSDLITRTQRKLDNTAFDSSLLIDFANDTQREIFTRFRLDFNESEDSTITTTAGSTALTGLPDDMAMPIDLRIFSPTNNTKLLPFIRYEDVDRLYPNASLTGNAPPIGWTVFAGVPRLVNNADTTYTLYMKYLINPPELTAAGDTPAVPVNFSEALVLGMYARALEHDDEFDKATTVRQQMDNLILDIAGRRREPFSAPHLIHQGFRHRINWSR